MRGSSKAAGGVSSPGSVPLAVGSLSAAATPAVTFALFQGSGQYGAPACRCGRRTTRIGTAPLSNASTSDAWPTGPRSSRPPALTTVCVSWRWRCDDAPRVSGSRSPRGTCTPCCVGARVALLGCASESAAQHSSLQPHMRSMPAPKRQLHCVNCWWQSPGPVKGKRQLHSPQLSCPCAAVCLCSWTAVPVSSHEVWFACGLQQCMRGG